jgi:hypothetical protein
MSTLRVVPISDRIGGDHRPAAGHGAVGHQALESRTSAACRCRIDAELFDQRSGSASGIVGRDQHIRIGRPLVGRIDDLLVEVDRQRDRRLLEGGVALGDDRPQQDARKIRPKAMASMP